MTIKTRIERLEKNRKSGDKKLIVVFDDPLSPTHVTVDGKRMTQGKFERLVARVGENAVLLHVHYREKKVVDA